MHKIWVASTFTCYAVSWLLHSFIIIDCLSIYLRSIHTHMHVCVHLSMFKQKVFHVAQASLKVTVSWEWSWTSCPTSVVLRKQAFTTIPGLHGTGYQTWSFVNTRQALCQPSYIPSPHVSFKTYYFSCAHFTVEILGSEMFIC